jgi:hypothetical protein
VDTEAVSGNIPPPPPGFVLVDDDIPPPPEGFVLVPNESPRGVMPFLNQGIAQVFGAPVDAVSAGLSAVGVPGQEAPVLGSTNIQQMMGRAGVRLPESGATPQNLGEFMGRGVGNAAAFLIPGLGAARGMAAAANPVTRGIGQMLSAAPGKMAAVDMAAGAGSGAGRYIGEAQTPNNPNVGGTIGEMVGGLGVGAVTGVVPMLARMLAQGPAGRAILGTGRQVMSAFVPGTNIANTTRASNRLRGLTADPEGMADLATRETIAPLTPAQRTGDERLLGLERAVASRDPVLADRLRQQAGEAQGVLESELRGMGGQPMAARNLMEERRGRLIDNLQTSVDRAKQQAQARIAALEPNATPAQQATVVRQEFDAAYRAAMDQERTLWRAVPDDVLVPTKDIKDAYAALVAATPETQRHNIPDYARRFLGGESNAALAAEVPPSELQGLRSELLDIARQARAAGERNRARLADDLADSVLQTMDSAPVVSAPYQAARDYTRQLNQTFRQGEIGRLTNTGRDGSPRVAPELTLDTTIGQGGQRGAIAAREFEAAMGERFRRASPQIEDYLRGNVSQRAVTGSGDIRRDTMARLLRQEQPLLDAFPNVRRDMAAALQAQDTAQRIGQRAARVERNLNSPTRSAVARYLSGDVGEEVARVFSAPDPAAVASQVARVVRRDPAAVDGLKGAFIDHLIANARGQTVDGSVLNGSTMRGFLDNAKQRAALEAVFSPDDMRRLRTVVQELTSLERARGPLPGVGAPMNDMPNQILDTLARVAGARAGAAAGGASMAGGLQSAQIVSGRVRDFLGRLTNDQAAVLISQSVTDPALFAALLNPGARFTPSQQVARLQAWLAGPGVRVFGEGNREERDSGVPLNGFILDSPQE